MANITLTNLPTVTALNGTEPLLGVQSGSSVQITTGQIVGLSKGSSTLPFPVSIGGTGDTTLTQYGLLFGNGTNPITAISPVASGSVLISNGTGSAPSYSADPIINTITATASRTATATTGAFSYGTNSFSDVNVLASFQSSVNSYNQATIQNTSNGSAASSEFIAYNDQGSAATNYATVGINSSGYTGTGAINAAGYGYFLTGSTYLVIGTIGANSMHFVTNSSATDAMTISSAGVVTIPSASITSLTTPLVVGGTTASSTLTLESTSGVGTSDAILFKTGSQSERMRIDTSGNVGIGISSPSAKLHIANATGGTAIYAGNANASLYVNYLDGGVNYIGGSTTVFRNGAGTTEFMRIDSSGNVGIGATGLTAYDLNIGANITGATIAGAVILVGAVQSSVSTAALGFYSNYAQAASATVSASYHFYASPSTGGAGSTISSQFGFYADSTLGTGGATTVTSAYGFYGNIASGANRWNLYMGGSANNYMAGALGVGTTSVGSAGTLTVNGNFIGNGTAQRFVADFDNATINSRFAFQTSTTNAATGAYFLPNGTSTASSIQVANASDPTNVSKILIATNGSTDVQLVSGINGTGTYLPLTFFNGGLGRFVIGTSGQFGVGPTATVSYGTAGQVFISGGAAAAPSWSSALTALTTLTATGAITFNTTTNNQSYTTTGAGTITISSGTAGNINNMIIGATTAVAGTFTTVTAPTHIGGTTASSTLTLQSTSGAGTTDSVLIKVGNNGAVTAATFNTAGVALSTNWYNTATQTATNTATLTAAQITSPFLLGTPTATASYTLPLASAVETALGTPPTNTGWEFTVFTTAAFAITLLTATGWTLVGSMATGATANSFARFRATKTGAGAYSLYRIS